MGNGIIPTRNSERHHRDRAQGPSLATLTSPQLVEGNAGGFRLGGMLSEDHTTVSEVFSERFVLDHSEIVSGWDKTAFWTLPEESGSMRTDVTFGLR